MKSPLSRISTPSMAVALTALFIALSGTAIALPGKGRVDKNDLRRGSVGTRAVANNSVRSSDIRNNTVLGRDIRDPVFAAATLQNGWVKSPGALGGAPPGYWIDGEGIVHLQGNVRNGANSTSAFVLPPGVRPQSARFFTISCVSGVGGAVVNPMGEVRIGNFGASNCQGGASLDGIDFRRDN